MGSAFDAHAPAAGFRLRGAEKLAFVSDMFDQLIVQARHSASSSTQAAWLLSDAANAFLTASRHAIVGKSYAQCGAPTRSSDLI